MMEPATEKQIKFAKTLKIENPEQFDKQALRGLIDVALAKRDGKKAETKEPVLTAKDAVKVSQNGSIKEFHLSPEKIRSNALEFALVWVARLEVGASLTELMHLAAKFEDYIQNGKKA